MGSRTYSIIQVCRFWDNVSVGKPSECWNWKRSRHSNGYGQVGLRINGKDRILKAHRVAWEIHNDTLLSPGSRVTHTCDNPLCCNPHHVVVQPLDKVIVNQPGPRGEKHGRAKLTEKQAMLIKYKLNMLTTREIADSFSVAFHTVWDIRKGITWRHI